LTDGNPTIESAMPAAFVPEASIPLVESFAPGIELSVVVPLYRSVESMDELLSRLGRVLPELARSYEIVLVDDGSPDDTWEICTRLCAGDRSVRAVRLSRNFGQHAAISAGLAAARGSRVAVMDADLQDPPEELPALYKTSLQGADIVFGRRVERGHSAWRNLGARLYFWLLNSSSRTHIDGRCGTFSILSRKVVDAYLRLNDTNRHYLFILFWLGFSRAFVDYEQRERPHGSSTYTLSKLIRHALQGMFFQSTKLLESIILCGFILAFSGGLLALLLAAAHFFSVPPPGWTSLAVLILLVGGVNLAALGFVGIYVGQVFEQVKGRPLFVIDSSLNDPGEGGGRG